MQEAMDIGSWKSSKYEALEPTYVALIDNILVFLQAPNCFPKRAPRQAVCPRQSLSPAQASHLKYSELFRAGIPLSQRSLLRRRQT